jgi:hypothetical protein
MTPELTLALMVVGGLGTFVLSLWTTADGDRPHPQIILIVFVGVLGLIVAMTAAMIIFARWGFPFLMGVAPHG